jgi:hypothetical protein
MTSADVVVPTVGRGSLALLLASLDGPPDRLPRRVIVVDDRAICDAPLDTGAVSPELRERLDVVASNGGGPAIARNRGWQASEAEWVAFLDDDVIPCRGWLTELAADLDGLPADVGASQGRLLVPMPAQRSATDRERGERLATARCANMAFRTRALEQVGGFDESSQRGDRDDAAVAVRMRAAGFRIVDGSRQAVHPLWSLTPRASADAAADADTASARWRAAMGEARGRIHGDVMRTATGARAVVAKAGGRTATAVHAMGARLAGAARVALARVATGSHSTREVATSVVARSAAACRRLRDAWRRRRDEARAARRRRATRPLRPPSYFDAMQPERRRTPARADPAPHPEDLAGAPAIPDEIVELTDCLDPTS